MTTVTAGSVLRATKPVSPHPERRWRCPNPEHTLVHNTSGHPICLLPNCRKLMVLVENPVGA